MEFRILGPLEVWDADRLVAVGGPKRRRVLAALVLDAGRVVPIERLIDAVWDGDPPATARRQVQNAVSALRQTRIGAVLGAQGPGYVLRIPDEQVDAGRFTRYLARADAARAARDPAGAAEALWAGLALWRGPALTGVGGPVATTAAMHLEERRLSAVTTWAEIALELGRHTEVADALTGEVGLHPLHEPVAGLLILALYRCGRTAEALTRYDRVRRALAEELGVDPGLRLRGLYERILATDPALDHRPVPAARNDLPRDIAHFTGRTAELDRLLSIADGGGAIAIQAVDGMAGVGKTALAVHAAHRLAGRFPDGQLFVDLHAHTAGREPLTAAAALDLLLRAVGVPDESIPRDADEKAARWRAAVADRRMLVVLDNALDAAQVRPLLPGSPRCAVLVTSRHRLVELDAVHVLSLDTLPEPDAIALFHRVARADPDRVRTDPDRGEAAAVAEVVRLCGHLPLAIAIAAARLRARPLWTVGQLARRLADRHGRSGVLEAGDRGVAAAFALSYRQLPPDRRRLYRLLGLHPGTDIDAYTAAALTSQPLDRAERLLEALCDGHLLTAHRPGYYRFHDLIRDHARTALDTDEHEAVRAGARDRLLDYYLHVTEIAADQVAPPRRSLGPAPARPPAHAPDVSRLAGALAWFQAEHANLLGVARLAASHGAGQHGWQIPRNIATYLGRYGYLAMATTALEIAVEAWRAGDEPGALTACLMNLSLVHKSSGHLPAALECLERAMVHARESGDGPGELAIVASLAELYTDMGLLTRAADHAARAVRSYRATDDLRRLVPALSIQIQALVRLGRYDEAIDSVRRAAVPVDDLGTYRYSGHLLSRLGTAHSHRGDHEVAIALLHRALGMARQAQDRPSQADYLHRLAQAQRRAGHPEAARDHARAALGILEELPDLGDLIETHNALGAIQNDLGQPELALTHHRAALRFAAQVGYPIGRAHALDGLGHALDALGDAARARHHFEQALELYTELGAPEAKAVAARLGS